MAKVMQQRANGLAPEKQPICLYCRGWLVLAPGRAGWIGQDGSSNVGTSVPAPVSAIMHRCPTAPESRDEYSVVG